MWAIYDMHAGAWCLAPGQRTPELFASPRAAARRLRVLAINRKGNDGEPRDLEIVQVRLERVG